jgi:hypothetical protein
MASYSNPKALKHRIHAHGIADHDGSVQQIRLEDERENHAAHEDVCCEVHELVISTHREDEQNGGTLTY